MRDVIIPDEDVGFLEMGWERRFEGGLFGFSGRGDVDDRDDHARCELGAEFASVERAGCFDEAGDRAQFHAVG